MTDRPRRAGFTIIEMLVVIAILTLLLAMILPGLGSARRSGRLAKCASNLHQILAARHNQRADGYAAGIHLASSYWTGLLLPYLGRRSSVYVCPEDALQPGTDFSVLRLSVTFTNGKAPFTIPAVEGPFVLKYDVTATGYTLAFDDLVIPDMNDVVLRFETKGGTTTITYLSQNARQETHVDLIGGDGKVLLADMGAGKCPIGSSVVVPATGDASYGMNSVCDSPPLSLEPGRILFLDYAKTVANPIGDNWGTWKGGPNGYKFARHRGRCNVAMADGSIRTMAPAMIDPAVAAQLRRYWQPAP